MLISREVYIALKRNKAIFTVVPLVSSEEKESKYNEEIREFWEVKSS
jgi:hypothetical protein